MFKKIKGNIFNSSAQVLVNTVNCVGVMGRGIALECKLRFPEMYKSYKKFCDQKKIQPGILQVWKDTKPWILNFPTKSDWRDPSKFEYLEKGLDKLLKHILKRNNIHCFSIVRGQPWRLPEEKVFKLMESKLSELKNIDIEVYEYDPNTKDDLFLKFYQKVYRFNIDEYKNNLNLKTDAATFKECN